MSVIEYLKLNKYQCETYISFLNIIQQTSFYSQHACMYIQGAFLLNA